MSTLALVARLERTQLRRSSVSSALLASFALLVLIATAMGLVRATREAHDRDRLLGSRSELPSRGVAYEALERGTFAVLPVPHLPGFALGQSDVYPAHFHITARLSDAQLAGDQLAHPLVLQAGSYDLLFVLLYTLPLLIVGLAHDLVASDRATGTLRLLLVQGATARTVVAGRLRTHVWIVFLLPVTASVLAAAVIDPHAIWSGRFVVWMVAAIVYGLFWLGVAVQVNARGGSAASNAMTLAGVWLLFVVLLPSAVNLATRVAFPVPSRVQLATALRDASREAVAQGSRTLGRYLEDHPATGTGVDGMRQFYMLQDLRDAKVAQQLQPVLASFQHQVARQERFVSWAQYLSPVIVAQLAFTDIAGTSGHRARVFADQAAGFQREWKARFPADVLAADASVQGPLPVFAFAEEPTASTIRRIAIPLTVLATLAGVLIWSGVRRFRSFEAIGK